MKNLAQDVEKTILIIPDTPPSNDPFARPSTSRSFSLNKIFFSSSTKATSSLPVTPLANSGHEAIQGIHVESDSDFSVSVLWLFFEKSFILGIHIYSY